MDDQLVENTESYPRGPSFGTTIDHDFRLACGFLADSPHLLKKNTFSADKISSAQIAFPDLENDLTSSIETYSRGPSFGITIDHDYRLACGFLTDSPHLIKPSIFSEDVQRGPVVDIDAIVL